MNENAASAKPKGLVAIEAERTRQANDALKSFAGGRNRAAEIAASLRRTGRLLMLGMGASHAVARIVEPLYRSAGIAAVSIPISEQLNAPIPLGGQTALLTSQSGESVEILRWLRENPAGENTFGLTLDPSSTLGRSLPCLVGAGGPEKAFAATRSLTVSLGLHLAVLGALGVDPEPALALLKAEERGDVTAAVDALDTVTAVVTSGRALQGVAEAIALGLMELARIPAFALEGGQLRHGPPEMFEPGTGLVFFRSSGTDADLIASTLALAGKAGSPPVVFDCSGEPPLAGAHTIALPKASGMAAAFATLLPAQRFMMEFATRRVADVGTPRRSSKITSTE